jgi:hypothetical protein
MLVSRLRVLLGACGVFFSLGMIAFAVMFSGRSMGLGSVFVLCCVRLWPFCYPWCLAPSLAASNRGPTESFLFALQYPILLSLDA